MSDQVIVPYGADEILPGTNYRLLHPIGRGGMATCYDAIDVELSKPCVLKILHPHIARLGGFTAERMRTEARLIARLALETEHVCDVYSAGISQDHWRLPFYAMERLVGRNGRYIIERQRAKKALLPVEGVCSYGIDSFVALGHAHKYGFIHRDVKPENLHGHRKRDGGQPIVKLLDFGVVALVWESETFKVFRGSYRYASPEQQQCRPLTVSSDIYSAALVLFEFATNTGTFEAAGNEEEDIAEAHVKVVAPRVSDLRPDVPSAFDDLVAACLEKNPAKRPQDAFAIAQRLRDIKTDCRAPLGKSVQVVTDVGGPRAGDARAEDVARAVHAARHTVMGDPDALPGATTSPGVGEGGAEPPPPPPPSKPGGVTFFDAVVPVPVVVIGEKVPSERVVQAPPPQPEAAPQPIPPSEPKVPLTLASIEAKTDEMSFEELARLIGPPPVQDTDPNPKNWAELFVDANEERWEESLTDRRTRVESLRKLLEARELEMPREFWLGLSRELAERVQNLRRAMRAADKNPEEVASVERAALEYRGVLFDLIERWEAAQPPQPQVVRAPPATGRVQSVSQVLSLDGVSQPSAPSSRERPRSIRIVKAVTVAAACAGVVAVAIVGALRVGTKNLEREDPRSAAGATSLAALAPASAATPAISAPSGSASALPSNATSASARPR